MHENGVEDSEGDGLNSSLSDVAAFLDVGRDLQLTPVLSSGDSVDERFTLDERVAAGGMGTIYRATDRLSGTPVAVKVLQRVDSKTAKRFATEALALAQMSHPAIVRYITHGISLRGVPFLVMEWLVGQDLGARLSQAPLALEDAITFMRRTSEGLGLAHRLGIVHRDIKPSNLFLANNQPTDAKVIDFGIARLRSAPRQLTRSGVVLGTVGYMAPEQARGGAAIDARADVFSLGCVLFECLAGRPAFRADEPFATLAKVLLEPVPRLRDVRVDVPRALDDLLARMLSKNPDDRPVNAQAVLTALEDLSASTPLRDLEKDVRPELTHQERRIVTVLIARTTRRVEGATDTRLSEGECEPELLGAAHRFAMEPMDLGNGTVLIVPDASGPSDRAVDAASCALALTQIAEPAAVGLATGDATATRSAAVGPLIDTAFALAELAHPSQVVIDERTADLLDARFDVRRYETAFELVSERNDWEVPRKLLGKATRFFGREKELRILAATLTESVTDSVSRAVLVVGEPGIGKTRLCREFRVQLAPLHRARVISTRGMRMNAASSLSLVRQLARNGLALRDGDERPALRAALKSKVREEELEVVCDFLAELVGLPAQQVCTPELAAARSDASLMAQGFRKALQGWLRAECQSNPIVIIAEDLQWSDAASVEHLEAAFHKLKDQPLMLLAIARPQIHDEFPRLRRSLFAQEVVVGPISQRAGESLVRFVLGHATDPDVANLLLTRSEGNVFFLEELMRLLAAGKPITSPDSILAIIQARVECVDPPGRRVLRAASVFGEIFWAGGVKALLAYHAAGEVDEWLHWLVEHELIDMDLESAYSGESQFRFRHALLQEAVYRMVLDSDRTVSHHRAGKWLENAKRPDAATIAQHFERAGALREAVAWYASAAQSAFYTGDVTGALQMAERGLSNEASGETQGLLLLIQQQAFSAINRFDAVLQLAPDVIRLVPRGTTAWHQAVSLMAWAGVVLDVQTALAFSIARFSEESPEAEASVAYAYATAAVSAAFPFAHRPDLAKEALRRLERVSASATGQGPIFDAYVSISRANVATLVDGDPGAALKHLGESIRLSERWGDSFVRDWARFCLGVTLTDCGDYEASVQHLSRLSQSAFGTFRELGSYALATISAYQGDLSLVEKHIAAGGASPAAANRLRALAHLVSGRFREATQALDDSELAVSIFQMVNANALRAMIALHQSDWTGALNHATQGLEGEPTRVKSCGWTSVLLWARAEALRGLKRGEDAQRAAREACARVRRLADHIEDPATRRRFLKLPPHLGVAALVDSGS